MAQAAHAYSYAQRERIVEVPEHSRIHVLTGTGKRPVVKTVSIAALAAAKVTAVVLVAVALIGFGRIALNTATVTMSMSTQELTSELATARANAASLGVQQSALSNPARIRSLATDLGLSAATTTETISLSEDVVVVNDSGELELANSIQLAVQVAS